MAAIGEQFGAVGNFIAGADLSAKENYFVKIDSAGKVVVAGAGNKSVGVVQEGGGNIANGDVAVVYSGIVRVIAGATVAAGELVTSTSAGKATPLTALTATVPGTGTTVTSSSAQPAMTIAGGLLPSEANGIALSGGGDGEFIYIKLI
jgi:hypothetical protein